MAYGGERGLPLVQAADRQQGKTHRHEAADQHELHKAQSGVGPAARATSSCGVMAIYLEPQEELDDLLQHERPKGEQKAVQPLCCDDGAAAHFEQHECERDFSRPAHVSPNQQGERASRRTRHPRGANRAPKFEASSALANICLVSFSLPFLQRAVTLSEGARTSFTA